MQNIHHIPVLLNEVVQAVPNTAKIIIDGTLGYGGHTKAILQEYPMIEHYYGFDLDPHIFSKTMQKFTSENRFTGYNQSYTTIEETMKKNNQQADFVLLDLGVNMEHFKDQSRGFSIQGNELLDMRFNPKNNPLTASEILQSYSEQQLTTIFQEYADFNEKKSQEISRNIIKARIHHPITHTQELKTILSES